MITKGARAIFFMAKVFVNRFSYKIIELFYTEFAQSSNFDKIAVYT